MKKLLIALCLVWLGQSLAISMFVTPAAAQNYYYAPTPLQQGYDAATNYGRNDMGAVIRQQKNTEAIVNAIRASHGLPPCSIGLLGQWQGRPAC